MEKFVSSFSALYYWNVPCLDKVLENIAIERDKVEYTVTTIRKRYRKKGEKIYLCRTPLPEGSVAEINGEYIASPELAFLQVANKLDILSLILLGMQLCCHPPGHPEKAITTKEKLTRFVKEAVWHRGRRKAMRAVKYIENGSNSYMESLLYMALTLSYILGGYSLKGAKLNFKISLNEKSAKRLKQKNCYADIHFKNSKVIIEYNSSAYHSTLKALEKDTERSSVLRTQGYTVFHLTRSILYSKRRFELFVRGLAKILRKRIRMKNKEKFQKMREYLRSLFPSMKNQQYFV